VRSARRRRSLSSRATGGGDRGRCQRLLERRAYRQRHHLGAKRARGQQHAGASRPHRVGVLSGLAARLDQARWPRVHRPGSSPAPWPP